MYRSFASSDAVCAVLLANSGEAPRRDQASHFARPVKSKIPGREDVGVSESLVAILYSA